MAMRVWTAKVKGTPHTVVARWNSWTFAGELVVDGTIVRTWGTKVTGPDMNFKIEDQSAFLRKTLRGFDLYMDEQKINYKQSQ
jgi:cbb3-type cytochrome oxidase cytochrome c subunit